jgi:hypothetical protein
MDGLYKLVSRRVRDTQIPSGPEILHVFYNPALCIISHNHAIRVMILNYY